MYVYLALLFSAALIHAEGAEWLAAEKRAQNAVVQVYAQRTEFNWLDPYRSPEQSQSTGSGFFIDNKGAYFNELSCGSWGQVGPHSAFLLLAESLSM